MDIYEVRYGKRQPPKFGAATISRVVKRKTGGENILLEIPRDENKN